MATTLEVTKQHFNVPLLLFSRQLVSAKTSRTGAEALTALEKFRLLSLSLFLSFFLSFFLSLYFFLSLFISSLSLSFSEAHCRLNVVTSKVYFRRMLWTEKMLKSVP